MKSYVGNITISDKLCQELDITKQDETIHALLSYRADAEEPVFQADRNGQLTFNEVKLDKVAVTAHHDSVIRKIKALEGNEHYVLGWKRCDDGSGTWEPIACNKKWVTYIPNGLASYGYNKPLIDRLKAEGYRCTETLDAWLQMSDNGLDRPVQYKDLKNRKAVNALFNPNQKRPDEYTEKTLTLDQVRRAIKDRKPIYTHHLSDIYLDWLHKHDQPANSHPDLPQEFTKAYPAVIMSGSKGGRNAHPCILDHFRPPKHLCQHQGILHQSHKYPSVGVNTKLRPGDMDLISFVSSGDYFCHETDEDYQSLLENSVFRNTALVISKSKYATGEIIQTGPFTEATRKAHEHPLAPHLDKYILPFFGTYAASRASNVQTSKEEHTIDLDDTRPFPATGENALPTKTAMKSTQGTTNSIIGCAVSVTVVVIAALVLGSLSLETGIPLFDILGALFHNHEILPTMLTSITAASSIVGVTALVSTTACGISAALHECKNT